MLNPLAVETMAEVGIDISHKGTHRVFDLWKNGPIFEYVITVCDETSAEKCPIFPGPARRLRWGFPDPSALTGTHEEKLAAVRKIRDEIRAQIETWCDEVCAHSHGDVKEMRRPRPATFADSEAINAIYNHYVRTSAATFQVDEETTEERVEELRTRPLNQPLTVLEDGGEIVGWGALSPFRSRCAYRDTIELTVYVHHDSHRRGYGRAIVEDLVARARSLGYHTLLAASCEESVGSMALLKSLRFQEAGRLREVGSKFGRRLDVVYLQHMLQEETQPESRKEL
ncbi:MAG: GNAT family N-acetyltransferase [Verrucomicrobiota bacterium]|nr:GNAT family N-acetyltransferase [Verrucomicrobiota bacterium]